MITPDDLREYHEGTGYNIQDTIQYLLKHVRHGYEESFDKSLYVFYFPEFIVIAGVTTLVIKANAGDV